MIHRRIIILLILVLFTFLFIGSCKQENKANISIPLEDNAIQGKQASLFTVRYRPVWSSQAQFAGVYMAQKKKRILQSERVRCNRSTRRNKLSSLRKFTAGQ